MMTISLHLYQHVLIYKYINIYLDTVLSVTHGTLELKCLLKEKRLQIFRWTSDQNSSSLGLKFIEFEQ